MIQKCVGNGIGILLCDAVIQQQLQNIQFLKVVQTFFQKAVFQPLPVALMDRHMFTSFVIALAIFFIFP